MKTNQSIFISLGAMFFLALLMAVTQGCGSASDSIPSSQLQRARSPGGTGGGKEGTKCRVVSGPNKGKTGTYSSDGWCEGSWGGTECVDSAGKDNGKCKDAKRLGGIITSPVVSRPGRVLNP